MIVLLVSPYQMLILIDIDRFVSKWSFQWTVDGRRTFYGSVVIEVNMSKHGLGCVEVQAKPSKNENAQSMQACVVPFVIVLVCIAARNGSGHVTWCHGPPAFPWSIRHFHWSCLPPIIIIIVVYSVLVVCIFFGLLHNKNTTVTSLRVMAIFFFRASGLFCNYILPLIDSLSTHTHIHTIKYPNVVSLFNQLYWIDVEVASIWNQKIRH